MAEKPCGCGGDVKIIFACSGAADVGEIADRASRQLARNGLGKMSCLSGVGAGLSGYIASANDACRVLVIDGCPVDCGRKVMEKASVKTFIHLRATDVGLEKGKAPANQENVDKVYDAAKKLL